MKKLLTILALGAVGTFLVAKTYMQRKDELHFLNEEEELNAKNFDAFPVEIPEEQFDALFV